jgi:tetratricopeptide (TPR) repeat protein
LDARIADGHTGRCWVRALHNQLDRALPDCDTAVRLGPTDFFAREVRGLVHLKAGRFDAALGDYEVALGSQPTRAASLYGRGIARRRLGNTAGGDADIAAAVARWPGVAADFERFGVKP